MELEALNTGAKNSLPANQILDRLIERTLFALEAQDTGLDKDPAVALQLKHAKETILARAYIKKIMTQKPEVSQKEILEYYQDHAPRFALPERVRASHILFRVGSKAELDQVNKAKSLCETVKRRIDQGEDFAALARQFSQDTGTREQGGDLGFFDRNTKIKILTDTAFAMEPGQVAGPLRSSLGYHILKLTQKQIAHTPGVQKVQEKIRAELIQKKSLDTIKNKKGELAAKWGVGKF